MSRANLSTVTNREWRFKPERTYRVPSTWADNGRREVPENDEESFYAVQIKLGVSLQWTVNAAGDPIDGPHRDKPTIRVCYVSRDGRSAYVRDWDAVLNDTGKATPEHDFASVLAVDPDAAEAVDDDTNREWYREVLRDRYDVTPIVADGGQSSSVTDRRLGEYSPSGPWFSLFSFSRSVGSRRDPASRRSGIARRLCCRAFPTHFSRTTRSVQRRAASRPYQGRTERRVKTLLATTDNWDGCAVDTGTEQSGGDSA